MVGKKGSVAIYSWVTIICSSSYVCTLCFNSTLPVVLLPLANLWCQTLR
jgi:hypothetical protein